MLSRALSLATVTLLIACFAADPAQAQNLEAGKSPSQIFAETCNVCHKSPQGLLKKVRAGSLPGFLRQHYTTGPAMASRLSGFLLSNGAADTRYVGTQSKPGKDEKSEAKPGGPPEQFDRFGHRLRPEAPEEAVEMVGGKEESAKNEAAKNGTPKSEIAKVESSNAEATKPSGESKSESARIEAPKETGSGETPALRADPVPPVTPAPPASSMVSAANSSGTPPEPALAAPPPALPAVTDVPPPVAPAGPPAPPISQ
jgi:hypothetical protein